MAQTGNEQTENHWPGYVDALTTMLMVLTFVMMILGVAVFAMSQNVSRLLIEAIARAAMIEPPYEDVPVPELADRILDKLRRHPPRPPVEKGREATVDRGRHDPGPGDGGVAVESRLASAAPAAAAGDPAPARAAPMGGGVVISFRARATRLDPDTERNLLALVGTSAAFREAARIEIRALVDRAAPSLTDARRVAYYRAMLARDLLIRAGIGADRMRLGLDEDRHEGDADLVRIVPLPRGAAAP